MNIIQWADEVLLKNGTFTSCFITVIQGDNGYDIEVEIAPYVIGGCYFGVKNYNEVLMLIVVLTAHLESKGILVSSGYWFPEEQP